MSTGSPWEGWFERGLLRCDRLRGGEEWPDATARADGARG